MTTSFTNYKHTQIEQKWQQFWQEENIYTFDNTSEKEVFSIDTPPPYVSADHLHAGHIMSYGQADFIARYKRMRGYSVFYPMGFDDNGLPTERFVEKKYNIKKSHIQRKEFINLCLQETRKGAENYRDLWEKLGISVDWTKTYSSINPLATKVSQASLIDLYKKGILYRDTKPVLWCTHCETALAQTDVEEEEQESEGKLYYISFTSSEQETLPIATTRPELLAACVALYIHPDDKRYQHLLNRKAIVPLFNYEIPIYCSEKVLMEFGTGLMMVSTWGDREDIEKWQKDNLPTKAVIDKQGKMVNIPEPYLGLTTQAARVTIVKDLQEKDFFIKEESISQRKLVHERCATPPEFILSKQWFIKVADKKDVWLEMGNKVQWHPLSRKQDYDLWVKRLQWDWCISRQRFYGVPLPIWYCSQCDEPIFAAPEQLPTDPTTDKPPLAHCPGCESSTFIPEKDVADTWATSSCTPFLLQELVSPGNKNQNLFPVSLRPNAFEIIRTWDFYSIVKSYYHFQTIPFEHVMISGHGLDAQGRKISKRLGNYIPSTELVATYGADSIRYWATGAKLGQNLRFNIEEIHKGKRTVQKLWSVANFYHRNITNSLDIKSGVELEPADQWILNELNMCIRESTEAFEAYDYARAREETSDFLWKKCADYYIEFIKYRLIANNHASKVAAQNTFHQVFFNLLKLFAPILPFITEAIYQELFREKNSPKSIHIAQWPKVTSQTNVPKGFSEVIVAIDEIRKYKSEQGLSLGAQLEKYQLTSKVDLVKYGLLIKAVMRITELN
ncbi:MAG: valine--tRNA ligase [Candidatus Abawacabacteria bacterium]|nr:valine--tRNA ligase [Candidatus Abawacabacteria bacterium]